MNSNFNAALFHRGKKLNEDEMSAESDCCLICLSKDDRSTEFFLQTNPDVSLLRCTLCGGASASKMPTDKALENYYSSYYSDNSSKVTFHSMDRFANHIDQLIEHDSKIEGELRILDYGGGDGSLGKSLAEILKPTCCKIEVVLVDYNKEDPFIKNDIDFQSFRDLKEVSGVFDIILASAVLEHIPQLNSVLVKLYSMLKPSGFFYARTPYMVPFKKIIRHLDFTYPGHVHDLGPAFW